MIHKMTPPLWKHEAICWRGHGRNGRTLGSDTEKGLVALIWFHLATAHPGTIVAAGIPARIEIPEEAVAKLLSLLGQRPPAGLGKFLRFWR